MKEPAVTSRTAALVIERHFGRKPRAIRRIHGGLANHVFEVRVGKEELILRISQRPEKLQVFMKEQWAVSAARRKNVPTPEILEVCNDVIELPYMISRKVAGRAAGSVGRQRLMVLSELGEYAAAINQIPTHDFGHIFDWSPNKLSRNKTWKDYLDKELALEERLEMLRSSRLMSPETLRTLQLAVRKLRNWKGRPTLNHGDIRLKNAMLNDSNKIIAILDWENCTSNMAPHWELSIALHDLTMDEKQSFLQGYGLALEEYLEMAPGIKAFNLLNYAPVVRRAQERKDKARLLNLRVRLNGALDLYSM